MLNVAIIGSTGSIGTQAIDVISNFPEYLRLSAVAADQNWQTLKAQITDCEVDRYACNADDTLPEYGGATRCSLAELVSSGEVDIFLFACVGVDNLPHLKAALRASRTKRVLLANKELLVVGGADLGKIVGKMPNDKLIPVDSEPTAIWQLMQGERVSEIDKVILTASGGAFRGRQWNSLTEVSAAEALAHPTWQMGRKITIDSATLVNKAYEVAEIHWYFGVSYAQIEVVIHPTSFVHGMVVFRDGACKILAGPPDMRYAIQYGLLPDRRLDSGHYIQRWSLLDYPRHEFYPLKAGDYPCYDVALSCIQAGALSAAAFAGANRAAVEAFCSGKIKFTEMYDVLKSAALNATDDGSQAPEVVAKTVYETVKRRYS